MHEIFDMAVRSSNFLICKGGEVMYVLINMNRLCIYTYIYGTRLVKKKKKIEQQSMLIQMSELV